MSTSKSFSKEDEARVVEFLRSQFDEEPDELIGASDVSVELDYSLNVARQILTRLALGKALIPELVMVCAVDGTESDDDVSEKPQMQSCHTCGETTEHIPSILFKKGPKFDKISRDGRPKMHGRLSKLRFLRPFKHQRSLSLLARPIA